MVGALGLPGTLRDYCCEGGCSSGPALRSRACRRLPDCVWRCLGLVSCMPLANAARARDAHEGLVAKKYAPPRSISSSGSSARCLLPSTRAVDEGPPLRRLEQSSAAHASAASAGASGSGAAGPRTPTPSCERPARSTGQA